MVRSPSYALCPKIFNEVEDASATFAKLRKDSEGVLLALFRLGRADAAVAAALTRVSRSLRLEVRKSLTALRRVLLAPSSRSAAAGERFLETEALVKLQRRLAWAKQISQSARALCLITPLARCHSAWGPPLHFHEVPSVLQDAKPDAVPVPTATLCLLDAELSPRPPQAPPVRLSILLRGPLASLGRFAEAAHAAARSSGSNSGSGSSSEAGDQWPVAVSRCRMKLRLGPDPVLQVAMELQLAGNPVRVAWVRQQGQDSLHGEVEDELAAVEGAAAATAPPAPPAMTHMVGFEVRLPAPLAADEGAGSSAVEEVTCVCVCLEPAVE